MLLIVLYCLNRRQKTDFSCLPEGLCTGGNCACLSACNCEGTLPGLSDCCPVRNPNEPSCFDSLQCNCDTDQPDPDVSYSSKLFISLQSKLTKFKSDAKLGF